jgi:hypothetical protein
MAKNSKGQSGLGSLLSIGSPTSDTPSSSYTPIGEILDLPNKMPEWKTTPTTHLQSTVESAAPVIKALTKLSVKCTRVSNDPGQTLVRAAYLSAQPYDFKVQLPPNPNAGQTTVGDSYTFSAYVLMTDGDIKPEAYVDFNFDLQYDSAPIETIGS